MPKVGMEPIRKSQITEAVLKIIAEGGIKDLTLDKAAKAAGVSKGVVAYYYSSKDALILESCETFLESYAQGIAMLNSMPIPLLERLKVIAYTAVGMYDELEGLDNLEEQTKALLLSEPEGIDCGFDLSLTFADQQKIILQIFAEGVAKPPFKEIIQKTYRHYFELIETIIRELLQPHMPEAHVLETQVTLYSVQYMALVDGILIYHALGIKTDHLVQALDLFLENTFTNN